VSVCLSVCVSVEHDHELCARMTEAMEMQFGGLLEWTQRTVYSVEARINSGGRGVFFSGVGGFPGTLKTYKVFYYVGSQKITPHDSSGSLVF